MISRFYDLSKEDVDKIKEAYCISYRDKILETKEIESILLFRQRLLEAIECMWKAFESGKNEDVESAVSGIVEVASLVEQYINSVSSGNIRQRLLFINNIDKEVDAIHNYIQWALHKYTAENAQHTYNNEKYVINFLKYVATKTLEDNYNIEALLAENTNLQAQSLKRKLSQQFMQYVDKDNLTFYDNYFLIGEGLQQISSIHKKELEIEKGQCDGCKVDDCSVSHCSWQQEKIKLDKKEKIFKKLVDICSKRLIGQEIDSQELDSLLGKIKDENIKVSLARLVQIPPIESRNDRIKKINIETLTRTPRLIDESKMQEFLASTAIIPSDKNYYEDLNLITTSLLLTRCDYSKATGEEIYQKYVSWRNGEFCNFDRYQQFGHAAKFLKKYNQNKQNKIENETVKENE